MVTAFLFAFAGNRTSVNADVWFRGEVIERQGNEEWFVHAKSGKAAFAALPGAVK